MSSILTNNSAMIALQTLKGINKNLAMTQNEISTGKSIATAKEDSALWSIAQTMQSDVDGFSAISGSLALGSSSVAVARNASESITSLLGNIKEKVVAAQEENVDRTKIQADIDSLIGQVNSIVSAAQFNGLNLLQGGDSVNVLSSLDRDANGVVTASQITVTTTDLTQTAGAAAGTGTGTAIVAAQGAVASGAMAPAGSGTLTLDGDYSPTAGDTYRVNLAGGGANPNTGTTTLTYIAREGDTAADVAAGLANEFNRALAIGDLSDATVAVTTNAGDSVLTFTNTFDGVAADTLTLTAGFDADTANSAAGGLFERLGTMDVTTDAGASAALYDIEILTQTSIDAAAAFGSVQGRLDIQADFVSTLSDNLKSGIGSLVDADMEEASARLQALQVQQQLGIQSLSIANQAPQNILSLFR